MLRLFLKQGDIDGSFYTHWYHGSIQLSKWGPHHIFRTYQRSAVSPTRSNSITKMGVASSGRDIIRHVAVTCCRIDTNRKRLQITHIITSLRSFDFISYTCDDLFVSPPLLHWGPNKVNPWSCKTNSLAAISCYIKPWLCAERKLKAADAPEGAPNPFPTNTSGSATPLPILRTVDRSSQDRIPLRKRGKHCRTFNPRVRNHRRQPWASDDQGNPQTWSARKPSNTEPRSSTHSTKTIPLWHYLLEPRKLSFAYAVFGSGMYLGIKNGKSDRLSHVI